MGSEKNSKSDATKDNQAPKAKAGRGGGKSKTNEEMEKKNDKRRKRPTLPSPKAPNAPKKKNDIKKLKKGSLGNCDPDSVLTSESETDFDPMVAGVRKKKRTSQCHPTATVTNGVKRKSSPKGMRGGKKSGGPHVTDVKDVKVVDVSIVDAVDVPVADVVDVKIADVPVADVVDIKVADAPVADVTDVVDVKVADVPVADVVDIKVADAPVADVTDVVDVKVADVPVADVVDIKVADAPVTDVVDVKVADVPVADVTDVKDVKVADVHVAGDKSSLRGEESDKKNSPERCKTIEEESARCGGDGDAHVKDELLSPPPVPSPGVVYKNSLPHPEPGEKAKTACNNDGLVPEHIPQGAIDNVIKMVVPLVVDKHSPAVSELLIPSSLGPAVSEEKDDEVQVTMRDNHPRRAENENVIKERESTDKAVSPCLKNKCLKNKDVFSMGVEETPREESMMDAHKADRDATGMDAEDGDESQKKGNTSPRRSPPRSDDERSFLFPQVDDKSMPEDRMENDEDEDEEGKDILIYDDEEAFLLLTEEGENPVLFDEVDEPLGDGRTTDLWVNDDTPVERLDPVVEGLLNEFHLPSNKTRSWMVAVLSHMNKPLSEEVMELVRKVVRGRLDEEGDQNVIWSEKNLPTNIEELISLADNYKEEEKLQRTRLCYGRGAWSAKMSNKELPSVLNETASFFVLSKPPNWTCPGRDSQYKELKGLYRRLPSKFEWFEDKIPSTTQLQTSGTPESLVLWAMNELKYPALYDVGVTQFGLCHRLDCQTSGPIIVAKTKEAWRKIVWQFQDRTLTKMYLVLVHGAFETKHGLIKKPIKQCKSKANTSVIAPDGMPSFTQYWVLAGLTQKETGQSFSLCVVKILTGRSHQIRVHMQSIGHPVCCDLKYGGGGVHRSSDSAARFCPRLFLHSYFLAFTDPDTEKPVQVRCPLHTDLRDALRTLSDNPVTASLIETGLISDESVEKAKALITPKLPRRVIYDLAKILRDNCRDDEPLKVSSLRKIYEETIEINIDTELYGFKDIPDMLQNADVPEFRDLILEKVQQPSLMKALPDAPPIPKEPKVEDADVEDIGLADGGELALDDRTWLFGRCKKNAGEENWIIKWDESKRDSTETKKNLAKTLMEFETKKLLLEKDPNGEGLTGQALLDELETKNVFIETWGYKMHKKNGMLDFLKYMDGVEEIREKRGRDEKLPPMKEAKFRLAESLLSDDQVRYLSKLKEDLERAFHLETKEEWEKLDLPKPNPPIHGKYGASLELVILECFHGTPSSESKEEHQEKIQCALNSLRFLFGRLKKRRLSLIPRDQVSARYRRGVSSESGSHGYKGGSHRTRSHPYVSGGIKRRKTYDLATESHGAPHSSSGGGEMTDHYTHEPSSRHGHESFSYGPSSGTYLNSSRTRYSNKDSFIAVPSSSSRFGRVHLSSNRLWMGSHGYRINTHNTHHHHRTSLSSSGEWAPPSRSGRSGPPGTKTGIGSRTSRMSVGLKKKTGGAYVTSSSSTQHQHAGGASSRGVSAKSPVKRVLRPSANDLLLPRGGSHTSSIGPPPSSAHSHREHRGENDGSHNRGGRDDGRQGDMVGGPNSQTQSQRDNTNENQGGSGPKSDGGPGPNDGEKRTIMRPRAQSSSSGGVGGGKDGSASTGTGTSRLPHRNDPTDGRRNRSVSRGVCTSPHRDAHRRRVSPGGQRTNESLRRNGGNWAPTNGSSGKNHGQHSGGGGGAPYEHHPYGGKNNNSSSSLRAGGSSSSKMVKFTPPMSKVRGSRSSDQRGRDGVDSNRPNSGYDTRRNDGEMRLRGSKSEDYSYGKGKGDAHGGPYEHGGPHGHGGSGRSNGGQSGRHQEMGMEPGGESRTLRRGPGTVWNRNGGSTYPSDGAGPSRDASRDGRGESDDYRNGQTGAYHGRPTGRSSKSDDVYTRGKGAGSDGYTHGTRSMSKGAPRNDDYGHGKGGIDRGQGKGMEYGQRRGPGSVWNRSDEVAQHNTQRGRRHWSEEGGAQKKRRG